MSGCRRNSIQLIPWTPFFHLKSKVTCWVDLSVVLWVRRAHMLTNFCCQVVTDGRKIGSLGVGVFSLHSRFLPWLEKIHTDFLLHWELESLYGTTNPRYRWASGALTDKAIWESDLRRWSSQGGDHGPNLWTRMPSICMCIVPALDQEHGTRVEVLRRPLPPVPGYRELKWSGEGTFWLVGEQDAPSQGLLQLTPHLPFVSMVSVLEVETACTPLGQSRAGNLGAEDNTQVTWPCDFSLVELTNVEKGEISHVNAIWVNNEENCWMREGTVPD